MATSEAPGRLELVRTFVNSIEIDQANDPLATADALQGWCRDSGLCPEAAEGDLHRLRRFREALRGVLESHAGEGDEQAAWRALQPFTSSAVYGVSITAQGLALQPQGAGAEAAIAAIFAIAYDAIGAGTWSRLKACRKHSCRWAFYDRSKNGSRAWCSMAVCGNRVKAQKRRLSRKNAHSETDGDRA